MSNQTKNRLRGMTPVEWLKYWATPLIGERPSALEKLIRTRRIAVPHEPKIVLMSNPGRDMEFHASHSSSKLPSTKWPAKFTIHDLEADSD